MSLQMKHSTYYLVPLNGTDDYTMLGWESITVEVLTGVGSVATRTLE